MFCSLRAKALADAPSIQSTALNPFKAPPQYRLKHRDKPIQSTAFVSSKSLFQPRLTHCFYRRAFDESSTGKCPFALVWSALCCVACVMTPLSCCALYFRRYFAHGSFLFALFYCLVLHHTLLSDSSDCDHDCHDHGGHGHHHHHHEQDQEAEKQHLDLHLAPSPQPPLAVQLPSLHPNTPSPAPSSCPRQPSSGSDSNACTHQPSHAPTPCEPLHIASLASAAAPPSPSSLGLCDGSDKRL